MLYCSNCQRLTEGDCPRCGKKARKLRDVQAQDPVLFFSGDYVHSSMVDPLLADRGIPYSKMSARGAALATMTGNYLEHYLIYVPYAAYEQSVRLIANTFGADPDMAEGLITTGVDLDAPADNETAAPSIPDDGNADPARIAAQYAAPERHDIRRALHKRFGIAYIPYSDWLLDRIGLEPGMRVLDIGCGSGDLWGTRALPDDLSVTMADMSAGMLETARERTKDIANVRFEFKQADVCDLPFEDEQYDLVLASYMLFHVPDLYAAVSEIVRVLKPNGHLSATTISKHNMKELYALTQKHGILLPRPSNHFTMEEGKTALTRLFRHITREDYESWLQITEAEPLVQYIQSVDTFGVQSEEGIRALREEIQKEIDKTGSFDISNSSCLFVCRGKRAFAGEREFE